MIYRQIANLPERKICRNEKNLPVKLPNFFVISTKSVIFADLIRYEIVKPLTKSCLCSRLRSELLSFHLFMYAIVEIAGQQFKVEAGMEIFVNRLPEGKGESLVLDKVLLMDNDGDVKVGAPYIDGAVVKATVLDDTCRGKKVLVFKKKRRKGYQKMTGHRQNYTKIQINEIA